MALPISALDGVVVGPGTGYPYGDIVDSAVGTAGTRVNRKFTDDLMQTAQKLMDDAGITPSGNPDNSVNGYQIFEAIINNRPWAVVPDVTHTGGNVWTNNISPLYTLSYRASGNMVHLAGAAHNSAVIGSSTVNIMTLPVGARPANPVKIWVHTDLGVFLVDISTGGVVTSTETTTTFGTDVYFDNVSFRLV